jgi:mono/diheme cytochrome c family protein
MDSRNRIQDHGVPTVSGQPCGRRRLLATCLGGLLLYVSAGCRQQMADQPAYRPFQESSFFADGRSVRPRLPGTVARGEWVGKPAWNSGRQRRLAPTAEEVAALVAAPGWGSLACWQTQAMRMEYIDYLPISPEELPRFLHRGRERFDIFCSVCHGRDGRGNGMVVQRGYTRPPNFHTDLSRGYRLKGQDIPLRQVPVGYIFEVISNGFGAMPDYRAQISVADRWAITAYVRALQFSQHAPLAAVANPEERRRLEQERGGAP